MDSKYDVRIDVLDPQTRQPLRMVPTLRSYLYGNNLSSIYLEMGTLCAPAIACNRKHDNLRKKKLCWAQFQRMRMLS